jgi:hypothetical protein
MSSKVKRRTQPTARIGQEVRSQQQSDNRASVRSTSQDDDLGVIVDELMSVENDVRHQVELITLTSVYIFG